MTTETEKVSLNLFIIALCESPNRWIHQATEGLTDEQLYYQPSSDTNSIAWLIWHLSRWRDKISAAVAGEPQVWTSEGWAQRFDIDPDRTGLGDTPEQVAAFGVDRDLLLGYASAAHNAIVERVSRGLAGKPLSGFRATPSRRIPVLCGMIVYVIRFNNQLSHR